MTAPTRTTRAISAAPCAHCPFRKDVPIYLRQDRREEIADTIRRGSWFPCHETTSDDGEGDLYAGADAVECAGSAKAIMADGGTTQTMRIAERLGMVDLDTVETKGPDCWSLNEWVRLAEGATGDSPEWEIEDEILTCCTVGPDCLAPAGFLSASGAIEDGLVAADGECAACGEGLCSNCADDEGMCSMCSEEDD